MSEKPSWNNTLPRDGGTGGSGNLRYAQVSTHGGTTTTPSQTYYDDYGQQRRMSNNTEIPVSGLPAFARNDLGSLQNNQSQPMSTSSRTGRSLPIQADVGNHQSSNQQDCARDCSQDCSRCGKAIPNGQWCDCPYGRKQESHAEIRTTVQCANGCGRLRAPWAPCCQPCQDEQREHPSRISCVRGLELGWAVDKKG